MFLVISFNRSLYTFSCPFFAFIVKELCFCHNMSCYVVSLVTHTVEAHGKQMGVNICPVTS
jgi:hypothetical protein